jgi:hypothetical protein
LLHSPGVKIAASPADAAAFSRDSVAALAIILAFVAARVVFSLLLDFGIDEAYTLTLARRLS